MAGRQACGPLHRFSVVPDVSLILLGFKDDASTFDRMGGSKFHDLASRCYRLVSHSAIFRIQYIDLSLPHA
jgi:hypothetical protein